MIRIDTVWLAVQPMDMRAGTERLLARVVQVFGSAQAHHGYLFANARATRIFDTRTSLAAPGANAADYAYVIRPKNAAPIQLEYPPIA